MKNILNQYTKSAVLVSGLFLATFGVQAASSAAEAQQKPLDKLNFMKCNDGTIFYQQPGQVLLPSLCDSHGGVLAGGGSGGGNSGGGPAVGHTDAQSRMPAGNGTGENPSRAQDYNARRSNKPTDR